MLYSTPPDQPVSAGLCFTPLRLISQRLVRAVLRVFLLVSFVLAACNVVVQHGCVVMQSCSYAATCASRLVWSYSLLLLGQVFYR